MAASVRLSAAHKAESIGILHLAVRLGIWRPLGSIRLRPVLQQTRQNAKDNSTAQEASLSILAGTLDDRRATQLFMPHLLAERSPMGNLTFLTPYDLGCVKTQKIERRREWFFSNGCKSSALANFCNLDRHFAKRSFYRVSASPSFHTTKTQRRCRRSRSCCFAM